ncbi:MerR family transcriptional regulator [Brevibacillus marinus]|uniref:MerR family transcriptional regulator n=1 Tax=Brevibacillus marinus TaxID=2496837 RepID=UPI000F829A8F|nr:MerR family transcriptional regulator [Brevibacillus marinus]
MGKLYRIGQLAELTGLSKRTIDYYTKLGLLAAERTPSNYRYYSEQTLERLKLIAQFKQQKLSLNEIRDRLQLLEQTDLAQVPDKIHQIHAQARQLEDNLLELKTLLAKLDTAQRHALAKQLSVPCVSLYQTLLMILGL